MAFSFIQAATPVADASGVTHTITYTNSSAVGDLLILVVGTQGNSGISSVACSDFTVSNAIPYAQATGGGGAVYGAVYYCICGSTSQVTWTVTLNSGDATTLQAYEWSGNNTAALVLDKVTTWTTSSVIGTSATSGALTPANSNELAIGILFQLQNNPVSALSFGGGYVERNTVTQGSNNIGYVADQVLSGTPSTTATAAWTGSVQWGIAQVLFTPSALGPSGIIVNSSGIQQVADTAGPITYSTWAVTAGNTLVVAYTSTDNNSNGNGFKSIKDGQGQYTPDSAYSYATHYVMGSFSLQNANAGAHTLTITMNNSAAAYGTFVVLELPGIWVFDALLNTATGASTAPSVAAGTTPSSNDFQLALFSGITANDIPSSAPSGWNSSDMGLPGSGWPAPAYVWQQSSSAIGATWGSVATSETWGCMLLGYVQQPTVTNPFVQVINVLDGGVGAGTHANTGIWWCPSLTTATGTYTLTAKISGATAKNISLFAAEVSGLTPGLFYSGSDQASSANAASGVQTATVTNAAADSGTKDFVVTGINIGAGSTGLSDPPTGGGAWTSGGTLSTGFDFGYRQNATSVTDFATWTWTTNNAFAAALASFSTSAATVVQHSTTHGNGTTFSLSLASTPTVGNAIIVAAGVYGGSAQNLNVYTLSDNQGAAGAFSIAANDGIFTLTGEIATFTVEQIQALLLFANPGAFDFLGAQSQSQFISSLDAGNFIFTGEAATLSSSTGANPFPAATGEFTLTGNPANLQLGVYTLNLATGVFTLSGQLAALFEGALSQGFPNLIGLDFYQALEVMQILGIYVPGFPMNTTSTVKVLWQKGTSIRPGFVINQSPVAGSTTVAPNTPVILTVAAFPFSSVIDLPPDWQQGEA